jgi:aminoglycoside phosphotransferase family enzyme
MGKIPLQKRLSLIQMRYLDFDLDVHIFSLLPIYICKRILQEGKVLLVKNQDVLYDLAIRTAQAYEDFKPLYYTYLNGISHAGS